MAEPDLDTQVLYEVHLALDELAWQSVRRNSQTHHAAGDRCCIEHHDFVPHERQIVGA